jgi:hypothetical protein
MVARILAGRSISRETATLGFPRITRFRAPASLESANEIKIFPESRDSVLVDCKASLSLSELEVSILPPHRRIKLPPSGPTS